MRSKKKYTNQTFTKRVDHEAGHVSKQRGSEPSICKECEAVYVNGRWTLDKEFLTKDPFNRIEAQTVICPACQQVKSDIPAGFVYIKGEFFKNHKGEIENLLKNEEKKLSLTNPLARIMKFKTKKDRLTVTTTTEHLAQHLGRALQRAYNGDVRYDFSHENKLARVYWERDT